MLKNKNGAIRCFIAVVLFAVVALVSYSGVKAYLTDEEETTNLITAGKNDISITESFPEPTPSNSMQYKKSVQIKNLGSTKAFTRVMLKFTDSRVEDMSSMSSNGTAFYPASRSKTDSYYSHLPSGWVYIPEDDNTAVTVTLAGHTVNTTRGELLGGYFYYTKILNANASTTKLVDTIRTDFESNDESYEDYPFDIIVYAESVQPYLADGTAAAASGWENVWRQFIAKSMMKE